MNLLAINLMMLYTNSLILSPAKTPWTANRGSPFGPGKYTVSLQSGDAPGVSGSLRSPRKEP
jgi:hypothetical protein